jgi:hypothetical protein
LESVISYLAVEYLWQKTRHLAIEKFGTRKDGASKKKRHIQYLWQKTRHLAIEKFGTRKDGASKKSGTSKKRSIQQKRHIQKSGTSKKSGTQQKNGAPQQMCDIKVAHSGKLGGKLISARFLNSRQYIPNKAYLVVKCVNMWRKLKKSRA